MIQVSTDESDAMFYSSKLIIYFVLRRKYVMMMNKAAILKPLFYFYLHATFLFAYALIIFHIIMLGGCFLLLMPCDNKQVYNLAAHIVWNKV